MPDSPQDKFPPAFWSWLHKHPDATVAAIIRVQALTPEIEATVTEAGCHINRQLQLLPSLAVEAPANALMQLADDPRVQRIEPDQPVRAL
jgi:hypothetical protein